MRRFLLSFAAFATLSSPAFATGGFSCSIKDDNLAFDAEAGFSYSIGGGLLNFRGAFTLPKDFAPKGLERSQVRKLLREVELRGDVRAAAIFTAA